MKSIKILNFLFAFAFSLFVGAFIGSAVGSVGVGVAVAALSFVSSFIPSPTGAAFVGIGAVKSTNSQRATLNELERRKSAGRYPASTIITDSYLRLEQSIQGSYSQINFNVLINQGSANVTERRLSITDLFCATSMSIFIFKAGTSTTASQTEIAQANLKTFPNNVTFSGANEAANLEVLYNSYLSIRIDSTVYVDSLDLRRFYRVGTAQEGVNISAAASNNAYVADSYENMNYGFSPLDPGVILNGRGKNEISISVPAPVNMGGTSSQNFVVCYLRGFLMQNAAKNS